MTLLPSSSNPRLHGGPNPAFRRDLRSVVAALSVAILGAMLAMPAVAQEKGKKKGDKSRTVSFEDDMIEAQYLRPDTEAIQGLSNRTRNSLIRIRKDFFAEIIRSAEDI